jgi:hypothetical protein
MQARNASRGEPSAHLPPGAFVAFMQNQDQMGNRAFGERINAIASSEAVHAIARDLSSSSSDPDAVYGRGVGRSQPVPSFCNITGELGELVRNGRREEFANPQNFMILSMSYHLRE